MRHPKRGKKASSSTNEESEHVKFEAPSKEWARLQNWKWWPARFELIINSATAVNSTSWEPTQDLLRCEWWTPSVYVMLFADVCVWRVEACVLLKVSECVDGQSSGVFSALREPAQDTATWRVVYKGRQKCPRPREMKLLKNSFWLMCSYFMLMISDYLG